MENLRKNLQKNVVYYRDVVNQWTQEELAEKAGVSFRNVQNIEYAINWPSDKTIEKIAKALKVEAFQLYLPENAPEQPKTVSQLLAIIKDQEKRIEELDTLLRQDTEIGLPIELQNLWSKSDEATKWNVINLMKLHLGIPIIKKDKKSEKKHG